MAIPRKLQVSLEHTPWYHCTSRCVRRAFLFGKDKSSGTSYDHRKSWLEQRFVELSEIFTIDLGAYAVMSNHYHVVLRIDAERASSLSDDEVVERWGKIFRIPEQVLPARIALLRKRLADLSWYMRCVNEPLARRSNREDGCKGRFWEGRFDSQALLDDSSILRCMTYVDLNPIRAGIAETPESSSHTSVKARIDGCDSGLMGFVDQGGKIPLNYPEYLELVDWSGRITRREKKGKIDNDLPPIVERLGYTGRAWHREMKYYGKWYARAVGSRTSLERYCQHLGQKWLKGIAYCHQPAVAGS